MKGSCLLRGASVIRILRWKSWFRSHQPRPSLSYGSAQSIPLRGVGDTQSCTLRITGFAPSGTRELSALYEVCLSATHLRRLAVAACGRIALELVPWCAGAC
jgi:hypothetical protein